MSVGTPSNSGNGAYVIQLTDPNTDIFVSGNPIGAVGVVVTPTTSPGTATEAQRDQFMQDLVDLLASNGWGVSCVKQYSGTATITPTE